MSQRYRRAKAIAMAALERPVDDRQGYIATECAGDELLQHEVLLRMQATEIRSGDTSVSDRLTTPSRAAAPTATPALPEGTQLTAAAPGDYRILLGIGEGGMGRVYLAERIDGDSRQMVALKLLKTTDDSQPLAERMAAERRILAALSHPNIAHLVDGGITTDGRPFLALEYVDGLRIDQWCRARQLSLRERIELFLKVCAAVEHAHRHLVIHRDLKPANILVTADGEPKLLDFGIARLLDNADPAGPTQTGHRPLTLAYASPEQIEGQPLTTAVDIWALGVVLYELLCGQRPFQHLEAGHKLGGAIVSGEVSPPSKHTQEHAHRHAAGTQATRATPRIPADVDAIVLKMLRRDPAQRYASVGDVAEDLRRFLQSRPVLARRGHALYRLRRFCWRHRWGLGATGLAAMLVAGFMLEREQQLHRVEAERNKAQALAGFMADLFANADPAQAHGEQVTVREVLDRGAVELKARDDIDLATRADLMRAMGNAYLGLQLNKQSLPLLEDALRAMEDTGATPVERARVLSGIAGNYSQLGENHQAIAAQQRGQALLEPDRDAHIALWSDLRQGELANRSLMSDTPPETLIGPMKALIQDLQARNDPALGSVLVDAYLNLGKNYTRTDDSDAAIEALDKARELAAVHSTDDPLKQLLIRLSHAGVMVGRDPAQGVALLQALDRDYVRLVGEFTPTRAVLLNQLAVGLGMLDRKPESLEAITLATEVARRTAGEDNRLYLQLGVTLALNLTDADRLVEAETALKDVLPGLQARSAPGFDAANYAYALSALGRLQLLKHDAKDAVASLRQASEVLGKNAGEFLIVYNGIILRLVRAHLALAQPALARQAIDEYQRLLDDKREPADSPWRGKLGDLRAELSKHKGTSE